MAQIVRIVRKAGLDYDGWRYVGKKVRQACELTSGHERTAAAEGADGCANSAILRYRGSGRRRAALS